MRLGYASKLGRQNRKKLGRNTQVQFQAIEYEVTSTLIPSRLA
jgi:hypothetical protein